MYDTGIDYHHDDSSVSKHKQCKRKSLQILHRIQFLAALSSSLGALVVTIAMLLRLINCRFSIII